MRGIAQRLVRSPSTISREVLRNMAPHDGGVYDSDLAHARAREGASRRRASRLVLDEQLRAVVQEKLDVEWSPEQIGAWLRLEHPERTSWHLCQETIYQAVYNPSRGGSSPRSCVLAGRSARAGGALLRGRCGSGRRSHHGPPQPLSHRPLVERHSRYVVLLHLATGRDSTAVHDALLGALTAMPQRLRRTLT